MTNKKDSICRIQLTKPEVLGIIAVLDSVAPYQIGDFEGERQGLATFRAKLSYAYNKIRRK